jgi:hypothetical protein
MNTLHAPSKKKESRDDGRNSLITMPNKEHSFYLSFYYSISKKTSILLGSLPKSGAFKQVFIPTQGHSPREFEKVPLGCKDV